MASTTYFTYESRPENLTGLKLLACSFAKHSASSLVVFLPSPLIQEFSAWVAASGVPARVREFDSSITGWSVKPHLCLHMLELGAQNPVWIDADIMLIRDPEALWSREELGSIVFTEDPALPFDESCRRTTTWGLKVKRRLPHTVNTCVLRFGPQHRALISEWCDLTLRSEFREAQKLPFDERPYFLLSDQDLLEGLLVSEKYSDVPVRFLRSGREIIHDFRCGDYRIRDRLRNAVSDRSYFVHGQGIKPWSESIDQPLYRLTSIFRSVARGYRASLGAETHWLDLSSPASKIWRVVALGNSHLVGCGPILQDWLGAKVVSARIQLGAARRRLVAAFKHG